MRHANVYQRENLLTGGFRVVQAPTWGYPTEGAYYRDASSVDALTAIKIPFLGINAEDDPVSCMHFHEYDT